MQTPFKTPALLVFHKQNTGTIVFMTGFFIYPKISRQMRPRDIRVTSREVLSVTGFGIYILTSIC